MTVRRNGSVLRDSLPLWNGRKQGSASGTRVKKVCTTRLHRNGSVFRDSVPLRNGRKQGSASGTAVDKVCTTRLHRNGSIFRDSAPLWKEVQGADCQTPMKRRCVKDKGRGADGAGIGKVAGGVYVRR